jgi:hypothetical protein
VHLSGMSINSYRSCLRSFWISAAKDRSGLIRQLNSCTAAEGQQASESMDAGLFIILGMGYSSRIRGSRRIDEAENLKHKIRPLRDHLRTRNENRT